MRQRFHYLIFMGLVSLTGCASAEAGTYDCETLLRRDDGVQFQLMLGAKVGSDDELAALCLTRVPLLKQVHFRPRGTKELGDVSPETVKAVVSEVSGEPLVVINIEAWKTKGPDAEVKASVDKLMAVLTTAQAELPETKFGFYSMVPSRDYYRAVGDRGEAGFATWQRENDRLKVLAETSDVLFPSIYTFFKEDPSRWSRYALANISEARRLGPAKPIYPFIWNRYHGSNEQEATRPIEAEFLAAQFSALFEAKEASGAIVWLASKEPWDDSATWVVALRQFLDARAAQKSGTTP